LFYGFAFCLNVSVPLCALYFAFTFPPKSSLCQREDLRIGVVETLGDNAFPICFTILLSIWVFLFLVAPLCFVFTFSPKSSLYAALAAAFLLLRLSKATSRFAFGWHRS